MIMAIITKATSVDKPVAELMNKIRLCKFYGWSPKTYNETSTKDIRCFKKYMELMK